MDVGPALQGHKNSFSFSLYQRHNSSFSRWHGAVRRRVIAEAKENYGYYYHYYDYDDDDDYYYYYYYYYYYCSYYYYYYYHDDNHYY